jgi:hypothetical protein
VQGDIYCYITRRFEEVGGGRTKRLEIKIGERPQDVWMLLKAEPGSLMNTLQVIHNGYKRHILPREHCLNLHFRQVCKLWRDIYDRKKGPMRAVLQKHLYTGADLVSGLYRLNDWRIRSLEIGSPANSKVLNLLPLEELDAEVYLSHRDLIDHMKTSGIDTQLDKMAFAQEHYMNGGKDDHSRIFVLPPLFNPLCYVQKNPCLNSLEIAKKNGFDDLESWGLWYYVNHGRENY